MMILGGGVYVKGPNLIRRLKEGEKICFKKKFVEFLFAASDYPKEKLDFNGWVQLYDDDISIKPIDDVVVLCNSKIVTLQIEDSQNHELEINFSIDQARLIMDILQNYINAFDCFQKLNRKSKANAGAV